MEPISPSRVAFQRERDVPLHLIQRGRGRAACFFTQRDGLAYLHWLGVYAARCQCAVPAYVLMSNHVHLLVTSAQAEGGNALMRALGSRYARYAAETLGCTGPLWEETFEAAPVYAPRYLLSCMRYIEDNPVRAGLVADPAAWRWSSYGANAWGREDPLVTPHPRYCALGHTPEWRRARYRAMFWRSPEQRLPALAAKGDSA